MITDLDGSDPPPRGGHARATTVVAILGAVIAYAAVSSLTFRGPFQEPSRSAAPTVRFTPAPFGVIDPAAVTSAVAGCIVPGSVSVQTVFVGGRSVVITRPVTAGASCLPLLRERSVPLDLSR